MSQPARIPRPEGGHRLAALGKRLPTTARLLATHAVPALAGGNLSVLISHSMQGDFFRAVMHHAGSKIKWKETN